METGHGNKYRQLHIEDYLREIPAEQGRETGVYAHEWITGNPDTNTDFWTDNLLDTILRSDNLNAEEREIHPQSSPAGRDTQGREGKSKEAGCAHGGGQGDTTGNRPGTDAYL